MQDFYYEEKCFIIFIKFNLVICGKIIHFIIRIKISWKSLFWLKEQDFFSGDAQEKQI